MPSGKPIRPAGRDGALPAPEFSGQRDQSDTGISVGQDPTDYRDLFEDAPCPYLVLDMAGTVVHANATFFRLIKRDLDAPIDFGFRTLLTSAGAIFFDTQLLPRLLLSSRVNEMALDLRVGSARVPVLANFSLKYEAGVPVQIRVALFDASERRLFERNLLRSRKEAEQVAEVILRSSDAIITLHADGRVRNWNEGATRMFGFSPVEALDKLLPDLISLDGTRAAFRKSLEVLNTGQEYSGETVARCKDGSRVEVSFKFTPHMEAPGTLVAYSAVLRNIADQKIAERALLQSEKLASVGRLASSIAHEINNPLSSVTNLLYLIGLQVAAPELKTLVAQAEEELARVSQITTHTLRFHRQSSSATDLEMEKLFQSVVALYRARLRNSSITTIVDRCHAKPLRCHEGELRQIVLNVVANAVDAMKHGGVLTMRCRESTNWSNGRAGVRLIIADNGTGIDAEILPRIFEPFYSTKGIGGTGLGLWVTEDLVEKNGGAMRVRSSKRKNLHGTTFSLFFPHALESSSVSA
jgi:PAS domain S-box-containing protein